jgi:hypothetical protein
MITKLINDIICIAEPEISLEERVKAFEKIKSITVSNGSIKFEQFSGEVHFIRGLEFIKIPTTIYGEYIPIFTKNIFSPIELVKISDDTIVEDDSDDDITDEDDSNKYW